MSKTVDNKVKANTDVEFKDKVGFCLAHIVGPCLHWNQPIHRPKLVHDEFTFCTTNCIRILPVTLHPDSTISNGITKSPEFFRPETM